MHFIVRLKTRPGNEAEFRDQLLRVVEPTRAEPGCVNIHVFESLRDPTEFAIHSEWRNEAAFEQHARLPHTVQFVEAAEKLLTQDIAGLRSRQIA
jgi:quinol monooxygenase YgiN